MSAPRVIPAILAFFCILVAAFWPSSGLAQDRERQQVSVGQDAPAILVADDVFLSGDEQLIATGNVEALYDGRRLKAREIKYDRPTERLIVKGPITLQEPDGTMVVLADSAELDRDMRNGLLRGARVVMQDQLQLAAVELARVNGRYNQLFKAAVTSCRICHSDRPPLWQIRARRVIHDQEERQLYFNDAIFSILGADVFYLPRLRLPDPTLDRATGFLVPTIKNSTRLGFGVKIPYFIRIGDHKDLTLTPYISTQTRTIEARYRQAFRTGRIEINGAIGEDDLGVRDTRGYLFGRGNFRLKKGFRLRFDIEAVTDRAYLVEYDISSKDRLDSEIEIERARRDEYIRFATTIFQSVRDGESNSTLPSFVLNGEYEKRRELNGPIGGELRFGTVGHLHRRSSNLNTDGTDLDIFADGRDVSRVTFSVGWHRTSILLFGILARAEAGLDLDHFQINQAGVTSVSSATELTPTVAVELRWPFLKRSNTGARHIIEPVAQVSWVGGSNPDIPNDESTSIDFDEGNLFSTSRFTAPDRRERGYSAAYGLMWTRYGKQGWQSSLAFGQVVRDEEQIDPRGQPSFTNSSGLQDRFSDVLIAGQLKTGNGFMITTRGLFDDGFSTTKAEALASWRSEYASLSATYIWLRSDLAEERPETLSEWAINTSYRFSRHWTAKANWRFNVATDESVRAGLGLIYTNECVEITIEGSRRFTSSTVLEPSTDI
ncbi:MAG: LPS assembly protein LptD, partial [Pseudomonadota bacterium]